MPYLANHTTAGALEVAVLAAGAVPAPLPLLEGVPTIPTAGPARPLPYEGANSQAAPPSPQRGPPPRSPKPRLWPAAGQPTPRPPPKGRSGPFPRLCGQPLPSPPRAPPAPACPRRQSWTSHEPPPELSGACGHRRPSSGSIVGGGVRRRHRGGRVIGANDWFSDEHRRGGKRRRHRGGGPVL